jgi:cytochrome c-type biogenesis protein CcmH/NrfG
MLMGDAMAVQGRMQEAQQSYRWAADTFGMMAAGRESATVWRSLGDRMLQHGDAEGAAKAYEAALREAGIRPTVLPMVNSLIAAARFEAGAEKN